MFFVINLMFYWLIYFWPSSLLEAHMNSALPLSWFVFNIIFSGLAFYFVLNFSMKLGFNKPINNCTQLRALKRGLYLVFWIFKENSYCIKWVIFGSRTNILEVFSISVHQIFLIFNLWASNKCGLNFVFLRKFFLMPKTGEMGRFRPNINTFNFFLDFFVWFF